MRRRIAENGTGIALRTVITVAAAKRGGKEEREQIQVQRGKAEGDISLANLWQFLPHGGGDTETKQHDDGLDDLRVA